MDAKDARSFIVFNKPLTQIVMLEVVLGTARICVSCFGHRRTISQAKGSLLHNQKPGTRKRKKSYNRILAQTNLEFLYPRPGF